VNPMLLAALLASPAAALTDRQAGPLLDLAAGVGFGGAPVAVSPQAQLSLGWWFGLYDDQYAFGRYWAIVANGHVDWRRGELVVTPTVEVRRGLELIVVGLYGALGGGLVVGPEGAPGWTARAAGGAKFRRTRFVGLSLRLEAGVDGFGDQLGFGGAAVLGVSYARPAHRIEDP
jgi:hypothetical protein